MDTRKLLSQVLIIAGGIGMIVGAVDPMEGSLLILPGSGLLALGTYLGQAKRRLIAYRAWAFVLVAIGVGALWGLSAVGGFGGSTGRSMWWGMLILVPYMVGWNMGIWGPESPRWLLWLGIVIGALYLVMAGNFAVHTGLGHLGLKITLAVVGLVALVGCIYRLRQEMRAKTMTAA